MSNVCALGVVFSWDEVKRMKETLIFYDKVEVV